MSLTSYTGSVGLKGDEDVRRAHAVRLGDLVDGLV